MLTTQKINELLSKNYASNITILGNYLSCKYTSILDNNNGTIFIASDNLLFCFKDQNENHWLTILKSFHLIENEHNLEFDHFYAPNDDIKYSLTTKEEVVAMAVDYFEQYTF
ncbi:hypothetical protein IRZ71_09980 [Flavobacterium sp. ANB]|uniref:hypothetical protein n=1 Tax=unclassified Flavobacterium TaxID=196869 RepID=UPI0012B936D9|nr:MULTISPECIES: hypothetical protein [unclassified Flavobacterium]MBF4516675.1 hypothetical protein [Flavobacterium sp. ANB]MTD69429.1 hypothetical protein [Flavobacterium sp. LC2016-13]